MKIAIIGAGFSGLALCRHLLLHRIQSTQMAITLFDVKGIGNGASGVAAGLLHPYAGAHAKLNARGMEGMAATQDLIDLASSTIGRSVTAPNKGILRLALTNQQESDFRLSAGRHPDELEWLDSAACQSLVKGCAHAPGLWIKKGLTIYSALYLRGLWEACRLQGVELRKQEVLSLQTLDKDFDLIIVAAGADCKQIEECKNLSLKKVKGQVLEFAWPTHLPPLSCALNSHVYMIMSEAGNSCLVGATYEKDLDSACVDVEKAKQELLPKAYELFPALQEMAIIHGYAGFRAVTPQRAPLAEQLSSKQWILSGMGSKGLLYHALYAKELIDKILE